jgi:hypothetical protein
MLQTTWTTRALIAALAFLYLGPAAPPLLAQRVPRIQSERYRFEIHPKTPVNELLPVPPRAAPVGKLLVEDLALVPEVQFQEPFVVAGNNAVELEAARTAALIATAHQIAKINFVNGESPDRFMERLLAQRPDLAGLPFTLGESCRLPKEQRAQFQLQVGELRSLLADLRIDEKPGTDNGPAAARKRLQKSAAEFWKSYDSTLKTGRNGDKLHPLEEPCAVAALTQMLDTEPQSLQPGLVQRLAGFTTTAAGTEQSTQALARLALFAPAAATRRAATDALRQRDPAAVAPHLLRGLRYPWPAVARNAADAIVRLGRTDLAPTLVQMLQEPDPRAPAAQMVGGKQVLAVRELVRVNHHRNCLLCHAPGNSPEILDTVHKVVVSPWEPVAHGVQVQQIELRSLDFGADVAPVLIPGTPLPPPSDYYHQFQTPDILVRADVTYLRQDFSVMHRVPDAAPWPELQRFDFLVRTRVVTEQEAIVYRAEFVEQVNPYHQLALDALRLLTGRDAGTTAPEWHAALWLP